eukprot:1831049-Prymnesium_polylepis.1
MGGGMGGSMGGGMGGSMGGGGQRGGLDVLGEVPVHGLGLLSPADSCQPSNCCSARDSRCTSAREAVASSSHALAQQDMAAARVAGLNVLVVGGGSRVTPRTARDTPHHA